MRFRTDCPITDCLITDWRPPEYAQGVRGRWAPAGMASAVLAYARLGIRDPLVLRAMALGIMKRPVKA